MDNADKADDDKMTEQEAAPAPRTSSPNLSGTGAIASPTSEKKWYIVNTYSGHENKAKLTLLERVRNNNLTEYFGDVLVPTESVTENIKGQRRTMTRKFFPGYMFVQMILDDRTFHLVKNTPKITGFLGGTKPTPVPEREIHGVPAQRCRGQGWKAQGACDLRGRRGRSGSSKARSRASRPRSKK